MVMVETRKEIKDVEIIERKESFDIVARHHFGISIISLKPEDALELRQEIDEWLSQNRLVEDDEHSENQIMLK
jgi:uncharacterized protein (DUF2344 family)